VIKAADVGVKVRLVHASRGKAARAEPIAGSRGRDGLGDDGIERDAVRNSASEGAIGLAGLQSRSTSAIVWLLPGE